MIHSKGYDSFTSSKYEEGATGYFPVSENSQVDVTYMPAHTVQIAFPGRWVQLEQYDAIVISDIGRIFPTISRHLLSLNPLPALPRY